MKIFISQPMNGKSDEEIIQEREEIIKVLEDRFGKDNIEFIDSFFDDTVKDVNIPVFLLGESIKKLSLSIFKVLSPSLDFKKNIIGYIPSSPTLLIL